MKWGLQKGGEGEGEECIHQQQALRLIPLSPCSRPRGAPCIAAGGGGHSPHSDANTVHCRAYVGHLLGAAGWGQFLFSLFINNKEAFVLSQQQFWVSSKCFASVVIITISLAFIWLKLACCIRGCVSPAVGQEECVGLREACGARLVFFYSG